MYHVISIGAISVLLYLLSIAGQRSGIITRRDHRAAWNILLLITFIFTAAAGIILALKASYKWDNPVIPQFLNWHVETGIGMSFIAIFHLSWHLNYYTRLIKSGESPLETAPLTNNDPLPETRRGMANLFLLGLFTGMVQLIFLKEIMNLSGGYELVTGIFFFGWLFISATGAYFGSKRMNFASRKLILLLPASAPLSIVILLVCCRLILTTGEYPTFITTLVISFISMLPVCFISGALFIRMTIEQYRLKGIDPGSSFGIETTGGIIAGILVAIAGGELLANYQVIFICSLLIFALLSWINREKSGSTMIIAGSTLLLVALVIIFPPDTLIRSVFLRGSNVERSIDSRYGNITTTGYFGEKNILYNHRLYSYPDDPAMSEENIHYAMLQHSSPESVLLISGGLVRHYNEIRKYKTVKDITYIEKDPRLIEEEKRLHNFPVDSNLTIVARDAFSYIKNCNRRFDVIIMLIPYPSNIETNRYFTGEFYAMAKKILKEGGLFMTTAGAGSNYPGVGAGMALSVTANTLMEQFKFVVPVKGNRIYMLASDNQPTLDFPSMINRRHIKNEYVNSEYLDSAIITFNTRQLDLLIDSYNPVINSLATPSLVYFNQQHELSKERSNSRNILYIMASLVMLPMVIGRRSSRRIFSASFSLAGTEIIALIIIQSTIGSMYQYTGLIISVLMAGLAAGALTGKPLPSGYAGSIPALLSAISLLTAFFAVNILGIGSSVILFIIIVIVVFIPAFLTGQLYKISALNNPETGAVTSLYGSDLLGAAAGFLIVSSFLIPLTGVRNSLFLLAFINFAAYITSVRRAG